MPYGDLTSKLSGLVKSIVFYILVAVNGLITFFVHNILSFILKAHIMTFLQVDVIGLVFAYYSSGGLANCICV